MRYFFKFKIGLVRFLISVMLSILTFENVHINALPTDEIVKNLLAVTEKRNALDDKDIEFIYSLLDEYNEILKKVLPQTKNIRLFRSNGVLDCLKYFVLLISLGNTCESYFAKKEFCSFKCENCLVSCIFSRTLLERGCTLQFARNFINLDF